MRNISRQKTIILFAVSIGFGAFVHLLSEFEIVEGGIVLFLAFLGAIGIMYYYHIEEPNNFFKYYEHHKKISNWNKSILFIYAKLIELDGIVSDKELFLIKKILKRDMEENYMPEHYQFLKSSFGIETDIIHPLRDVFDNFGNKFRLLFINNLVQLATLDGLLTEKEELFILNVSRKIGVGKRAFYAILERNYFIREEQIKSRNSYSRNINLERAFKILGVSKGSSLDKVKTAYRELVKIYHPDKLIKSKINKEQAKQQFQAITDAYETIKKEIG